MKLIYVILFAFGFLGCEKNEIYTEKCATTLEESVGLRIVSAEIAEYSCITNIYEGTFKGQSVFITSVVDPLCQTAGTVGVYNCQGEFLDNIKPDYNFKIGELLLTNRPKNNE